MKRALRNCEHSAQVDAQAHHWVVLLSTPEATEDDRNGFNRWLAADSRHWAAYRDAARVWSAMDGLTHLRGSVCIDDLARFARPSMRQRISEIARGFRRPIVVWTAIASAATSVLVVVLIQSVFLLNTPAKEYATEIAQIRDISLEDGSVIVLGAKSQIEIVYTPVERRAILLSGEAFFDVAKDRARPFVVTANDTAIRAIGTRFEVRHGARGVRIAVASGIVEVSTKGALSIPFFAGSASRATMLRAGQQIVATSDSDLGIAREIDRTLPGAWRAGWLSYVSAPLTEVIADANRYHDGCIQLADDGVETLLITGSFHTDRIDLMLLTLESILPIRAMPASNGCLLLRAKESAPQL